MYTCSRYASFCANLYCTQDQQQSITPWKVLNNLKARHLSGIKMIDTGRKERKNTIDRNVSYIYFVCVNTYFCTWIYYFSPTKKNKTKQQQQNKINTQKSSALWPDQAEKETCHFKAEIISRAVSRILTEQDFHFDVKTIVQSMRNYLQYHRLGKR